MKLLQAKSPTIFALLLIGGFVTGVVDAKEGTVRALNTTWARNLGGIFDNNHRDRKRLKKPPDGPAGLVRRDELVPWQALEKTNVPPVDRAKVKQEDVQRAIQGLPPRYAITNGVNVDSSRNGRWENTKGEDVQVWRQIVSSPGCNSLNFGFSKYYMPQGGKLFIYDPETEKSISRPFTEEDNAAHGELWTPIIDSCKAVIEVNLGKDTPRGALKLHLSSANVGYRGFGTHPHGVLRRGRELSGDCNVDVVCPEGNGWIDECPCVGAISTGGSLFCSGFMVGNTANDQKPYFMTANHCGINNDNAASLVVYWKYETSICGGTPDGTLDKFNTGSTFRSGYSSSDFTLVELKSDPDPAWGITFCGWDRTGNDATSAVAIHHPSVDEKRISFEDDPTTTTSYLETSSPGAGTHVRVADWDVGTTEGGSSGSPLFDQDHHVIGQLHGGYAACNNNRDDWYGKFSVSWNGGGTSASRLRDWLDPLNSGLSTVDTLVPGASCTVDSDCVDGRFCTGVRTCDGNGVCQPGTYPCPGQECNEITDTCVSCTVEFCDDGLFCNGAESCDGSGLCQAGIDPCPGRECDEIADACLEPLLDVQGLLDQEGGEQTFDVEVPPDCSSGKLIVRISGGIGDADLYVKQGSVPTQSDYDCRPYTTGNEEECVFNSPAGIYYIMIHAYSTYEGVQLLALSSCSCTVDSDCDDGLFCNGVETCDANGVCQAGADPCQAGQVCDEINDMCGSCDYDGVCELGETCNSCPVDCISGVPSCGNNVCEPGEDCLSCPEDCKGRQSGKPSTRYCCSGTTGGAGGENPKDCNDPRCTDCSFGGSYCCGNGSCETGEDFFNCEIDCQSPPPPPPPPPTGTETSCNDGIDNDSDGLIDCDDPDCSTDSACASCVQDGDQCNVNGDCCSGKCHRNRKFCQSQ